MAAQQNNSPVPYSYCNQFFMRDFRGEFGLINAHLCDILPAVLSGKVGDFFVWRVVTVYVMYACTTRKKIRT